MESKGAHFSKLRQEHLGVNHHDLSNHICSLCYLKNRCFVLPAANSELLV